MLYVSGSVCHESGAHAVSECQFTCSLLDCSCAYVSFSFVSFIVLQLLLLLLFAALVLRIRDEKESNTFLVNHPTIRHCTHLSWHVCRFATSFTVIWIHPTEWHKNCFHFLKNFNWRKCHLEFLSVWLGFAETKKDQRKTQKMNRRNAVMWRAL